MSTIDWDSDIIRDRWDNGVVIIRESGTTDAYWDSKVKNLVYDSGSMSWVAMTQPGGGGGGGGSPAGFGTLVSGMPAQVSVGATSTLVFSSNANRKYAHIANHSNKVIFVELGSAAVLSQGIRLSPNSLLTFSGGDLWLGSINAITASGTAIVSITEAEL